jgi:hypothetical protein
MEIVLLWLDDLDDLLFSVALTWERLRLVPLQIGLAAAVGLAGSELSMLTTHWAPVLSGVAAASVGAWFLGAALWVCYYREANSRLTGA